MGGVHFYALRPLTMMCEVRATLRLEPLPPAPPKLRPLGAITLSTTWLARRLAFCMKPSERSSNVCASTHTAGQARKLGTSSAGRDGAFRQRRRSPC